ncbi:MAG: hypothetical protein ABW321_31635 [Polyangiales bacterium]
MTIFLIAAWLFAGVRPAACDQAEELRARLTCGQHGGWPPPSSVGVMPHMPELRPVAKEEPANRQQLDRAV